MPANQVAHGVIEISAPARELPKADEVAAVTPFSAPVSTGAPPPAVVVHKTVNDPVEAVAEVKAESTDEEAAK
jgi:hypothetical protein